MVHNRVAPNLLMLVLLIGGLFMASQIKKELFPDFALDEVRVSVAYPGASPEEVEQGIVQQWKRPSTASRALMKYVPRRMRGAHW